MAKMSISAGQTNDKIYHAAFAQIITLAAAPVTFYYYSSPDLCYEFLASGFARILASNASRASAQNRVRFLRPFQKLDAFFGVKFSYFGPK